MKKFMLSVFVLGLLFASACNKGPSSTRPSFQWTYSGATFTADTVFASKGDSFAGSWYPPQIYAKNTSVGIDATVSSLNAGVYGDVAGNRLVYSEPPYNGVDISPFSVTITSSNGIVVNGRFSGTLNSQPISGTFSNVPIR